jgi:hypothetical protein
MNERSFYLGVRECGCASAALVDDEKTTAAEVSRFAKDLSKSGRRLKHVTLKDGEHLNLSRVCEHTAQQLDAFSATPEHT